MLAIEEKDIRSDKEMLSQTDAAWIKTVLSSIDAQVVLMNQALTRHADANNSRFNNLDTRMNSIDTRLAGKKEENGGGAKVK